MTILVTGAAGFIAFHTIKRLIEDGNAVVGIDNINNAYDVSIKHARLEFLQSRYKAGQFTFAKLDICDYNQMLKLCREHKVTKVLHLAALAGVRESIARPFDYIKSNIEGHCHILELCRHYNNIERLVYASSSSVYGERSDSPFSEKDKADTPASLYGASKMADELMTAAYSHLFNLNAVGLRFFTVYGPWGRPDMATWLFIKAIVEGTPLQLFNQGRMKRDFTFIDDAVDGVVGALNLTLPGHRVYNIGNSKSTELSKFLALIEQELGRKTQVELLPMQAGDVLETCADVSAAHRDFGFNPKTSIEQGLHKTVQWYLEYHKV